MKCGILRPCSNDGCLKNWTCCNSENMNRFFFMLWKLCNVFKMLLNRYAAPGAAGPRGRSRRRLVGHVLKKCWTQTLISTICWNDRPIHFCKVDKSGFWKNHYFSRTLHLKWLMCDLIKCTDIYCQIGLTYLCPSNVDFNFTTINGVLFYEKRRKTKHYIQ